MKPEKSPAKRKAAGVQAASFSMAMSTVGEASDTVRIRFDNVTVIAPKPSASERIKNIQAGEEAFKSLAKVLESLPVDLKLPRKPGIPLFRADPEDPATLVIRELDGNIERGRFIDGQFVSVE